MSPARSTALTATTLLLLVGVPASAHAADAVGIVDVTTGEWHVEADAGTASFFYGNPGDAPFMGDWDCDGVDTPGLYRRSDGFVYLRNSNSQGTADIEFFFGNPGDVPIAGDFDGDGCDTVSVYRPDEARFYVIDRLGSASAGLGAATSTYLFGNMGDQPFAGDFDGDGIDTMGLHRRTTGFTYLRNTHSEGIADGSFFFGDPDDLLVAADWTGDGTETPGVFRPGDERFLLRHANGPGTADETRALCVGRGVPVAGDFGGPADGGGVPPATEGVVLLPTRTVTIAVDPAEAVALVGGARILAQWPGGVVHLDTGSRQVTMPEERTTVKLAYVGVDGSETGLCWHQEVPAGVASLNVVQPWRTARPTAPGGVLLAWQAAGDTVRYVAQLDSAPGLTVTSPVWWHVRADGSLSSTADRDLVAAAHARGIAVWPAVASLEPDRAHAALADPGARRRLALELSDRARRLGVEGVNIDIEGYRMADAAAVVDFARILTEAVHGWGGVTSLDLTMRSETWQLTVAEGPHWSTAPDRRRLAAAVDYLALMAYDQHNRVRPAGPVASPAWVEEGLRFLLRYANPDRIILGVPFYGRVWDPAALHRPQAVGLGTIESLAASGPRAPDPTFGVDRVDLADGRFLWAELPAGLAHRVELVERYGLAGIAAWRLGFDPPSVWPVLAR